jgi:hypothetical protein
MSPILGILASGRPAAATSSYESIATANGTGSSSTITFSSIPSTYTHLQLRYIARDDRAITNDSFICRFNSDTGSNYMEYHLLYADGATVGAAAGSASATSILMGTIPGSSALANAMGVGVIDILDYANVNKYKTTRSLQGIDYNGSGIVRFWSGLWMNSASAISSITLTTGTASNWTGNAQFALYGIKGA